MIGDKNFDKVSNINIKKEKVLIPAEVLIQETPLLKGSFQTVKKSRTEIAEVIHGKDDRVVVVVGPCSIHDTDAAIEYAKKLKAQVKKFEKEIIIVMRVYFEKPRTTVGWKGLINDPDLDDSFNINKGLRLARNLLSDLTDMGLPCATEFLDVITPQYFAELISWGAIGARTVESQVHRELASGLSASIGFKNATNGDVQVAVDAIKSATYSHHFLSTTKSGSTAIFETKGNPNGHVILRGGASGPNFSKEHVDECIAKLKKSGIDSKVMIDCSHGNSQKDHTKQNSVLENICEQIKVSDDIFGVMIESNLVAGNQDINTKPLTYGQSVTDKCVDFDETVKMLEMLANAVKAKRNSQEKKITKEESQFSLL
ncbi:3-deoxy-7-phosphoheptulonate synthase [Francisella adeliensis]|uniref:Phospho-2-dehydro-3-deoxyheptonate aldolase n=1 Tax=Francisella adeliensis TaxID=2007306 RepID=A0A2Z4XZ81_9GAMM|nr:3-deoxy-7-phosphoheptulonate synthase [Francisella adeliensis]AXA33958.1 3-deoxy-7-phosphoheptulonate synthase [Francisella adeliensis]MBK2085867.1 3-deoxy-7-phosphoheptulonate synthase [Francisella adeliensis]MBK2097745.1 3-deoxy-7-phosphoheptulonate synthase [Francisella adeliensis]QIW12194.1 3-deoxy-7-phosphoheptulonate synthase [Francisella adeliensis]QIW14070.1 3-deoxy-7-phosphoheptulonate synthase [Francisella adeliensis]